MSGLDVLGNVARSEQVGVALWTSHADAKAGIASVRSLQQFYANVVKQHSDASKYGPQVNPIVDAADKWDAAIVFYTDAEGVDLGRQAEALYSKIAAEYGYPLPVKNAALSKGVGEVLQDTGSHLADLSTWSVPWWVWASGGVALGSAALFFLVPVVVPLLSARRGARALLPAHGAR